MNADILQINPFHFAEQVSQTGESDEEFESKQVPKADDLKRERPWGWCKNGLYLHVCYSAQ